MYEVFVRWTEKKVAALERWPLEGGRNVKAKPLQQNSLDNWIRLCGPSI